MPYLLMLPLLRLCCRHACRYYVASYRICCPLSDFFAHAAFHYADAEIFAVLMLITTRRHADTRAPYDDAAAMRAAAAMPADTQIRWRREMPLRLMRVR